MQASILRDFARERGVAVLGPQSGRAVRNARPALRVIVIDDEADLCEMLAEELTAAGYEVTCATNGRDAVRAVRHGKFDAVITDFRMPEMDGLETAAALKALDPDLPIIMATGYAFETALLVPSKRQMLAGLLSKPFALAQLVELIERAICGRAPTASQDQPR